MLRLRSSTGQVAAEAQRAICKLTGSAACGEPGVPKGADGDHTPGDPDRNVYDAECKDDLPGRLVRGEGDDPSGGDPEANQVYDNLGKTFEYYADTFGRDSYDNSGAELIASINFCENPGTPTRNAYWDGHQMKFGDGYAASLGVTAHELTHAITDRTADLEYKCQSGALNESMLDIFASNVDSDDWEIGEDLRAARCATWPIPRTAIRRSRATSATTSRCPTTAIPTTTAAVSTTTAGSATGPTT